MHAPGSLSRAVRRTIAWFGNAEPDRDVPDTSIRVRLALGAEIPEDELLHEFPVIVLDRAPQLQDYRFLLAADAIVVVDPRDRSIALVIDRT